MLNGIRIIEVEGLGPGPFAAMLLADLGADVVTIHRKGQHAAPGMPEQSVLDRGKRSIDLDLKDPADLDIAAGCCIRYSVGCFPGHCETEEP